MFWSEGVSMTGKGLSIILDRVDRFHTKCMAIKSPTQLIRKIQLINLTKRYSLRGEFVILRPMKIEKHCLCAFWRGISYAFVNDRGRVG